MYRIVSVPFSEFDSCKEQGKEHFRPSRNFPWVSTYVSTTDPRIRSFHSTLFCYIIDEML